MKKTLILLAGFPGTGKTYLGNMILSRFPDFKNLSPDEIKEEMWDKYGFDDLNQKEKLIIRAWSEYYDRMENDFKKSINLLSDYPFSIKQKKILEELCKKYDYQVITIRLIADLDVLFERQKNRDLDNSRHFGHIVKTYHIKDQHLSHEKANNLLDYKEFMDRMLNRGYDKFELGHLIEMDVTDFSKVDYEAIMDEIKTLITK